MKTRFLIAAALAVVAAPAFANTPANPNAGALSNDSVAKPGSSDINGDALTTPYHRGRQSRTDAHPMMDRGRSNFVPPRMDASGVPDPRV